MSDSGLVLCNFWYTYWHSGLPIFWGSDSGSKELRVRSRALEGRSVHSKSPSKVRDLDVGVAGRNGREKCFLDKGSLICPPGKSIFFCKKETENRLS